MTNSRCFRLMKVITISFNLLAFSASVWFILVAVFDQLSQHLNASSSDSSDPPAQSIFNSTLLDEDDVFLQQLPRYILIIFAFITALISGIGLIGFIQENVVVIFVYAVLITASWILRIASMFKFSHYTVWTDIFVDVIFLLLEALLVFLSFRIAYELKRTAVYQPEQLDTFVETRTSTKTVALRVSTNEVKDKETDMDELDTSITHNEPSNLSAVNSSHLPLVVSQGKRRKSLSKASLNVKTNFG